MDGPLVAATGAALAETDRATAAVKNFVGHIAAAQHDLAPVVVELFRLSRLLNQMQGMDVPVEIEASVSWAVENCSETCKGLDAMLARCDAGPLCNGHWALSKAPGETRDLRTALETCRKTVESVVKAIEGVTTSDQTDRDIGLLRRSLTPDWSRHDALLAGCLDATESYFVPDHASISDCSDDALYPSHPSTPSAQDVMMAFRKASLQQEPEPHHDALSRPDAMAPYEDRIVIEASPRLPLPPLATIKDEDSLPSRQHEKPGSKPIQLRLSQRPQTSTYSRRPATATYSLFPPALPPPTKALPPIPPLRSPLRPAPTHPFITARTPHSPVNTRSRASSDATQDSKFSSLSSAQTRFSAASHTSFPPPPRSSSHSYKPPSLAPTQDATEPIEDLLPVFDVIPLRRLETKEKDAASGGAYYVDTSPSSTILASRHGKFHLRLWDLPSGTHLTTIKVPFYIQAQMRSREYFVRSHAILSETLNLIAIASAFGQTIEIWDWAKRKKIQTINDAHRWASAQGDVYETSWNPLAAYREDEDTIKLYPTLPGSRKPFDKPRVIELRKAGLPHIPKLPELAYSATGPLLVAAAGPRPPRPGYPPPVHGALLMAWQLDSDGNGNSNNNNNPSLSINPNQPYRYYEPHAQHPELDNSLPLVLATYGSVSISIWEAAKFRTIGKPGMWQVEPVSVTERIVLVWDFGSAGEDKARTFRIPAVLACISPDCRFLAYCDPGSSGGGGALVVLDAIRGGRELWRLDGDAGDGTDSLGALLSSGGVGGGSSGSSFFGNIMSHTLSNNHSGRPPSSSAASFETRRSGGGANGSGGSGASGTTRMSMRSERSSTTVGGGGLELLAADLQKVTELAFSGDGNRLFVGDVEGGVAVFEVREGIGMAV